MVPARSALPWFGLDPFNPWPSSQVQGVRLRHLPLISRPRERAVCDQRPPGSNRSVPIGSTGIFWGPRWAVIPALQLFDLSPDDQGGGSSAFLDDHPLCEPVRRSRFPGGPIIRSASFFRTDSKIEREWLHVKTYEGTKPQVKGGAGKIMKYFWGSRNPRTGSSGGFGLMIFSLVDLGTERPASGV